MTAPEKEHIVKALQFELSKVETKEVRQRMLSHLVKINEVLAAQVGLALGEKVPTSHPTALPDGTADSAAEMNVLAVATSETSASGGIQRTGGLSLVEGQPMSVKGRKVAILAAPGSDAGQITAMKKALQAEGVKGEIIGTHLGVLEGTGLEAFKTFANSASVMFDAVYVPGGAEGVAMLRRMGDPHVFLAEAYKHGKAIAAAGEGMELLAAALPGSSEGRPGVVTASDAEAAAPQFLAALRKHRHFDRMDVDHIPA